MPTLEPKPAGDHKYDVLPPQTVFALFENPEMTDKAVQRLTKTGVPADHIEVLTGEEGARRLEPGASRVGGVKGFVSAFMQEITDETTALTHYKQHMLGGESLLAVHFAAQDKKKAQDERATITAVLLDSGASHMSYTSNWTLTKIVEPGRTV